MAILDETHLLKEALLQVAQPYTPKIVFDTPTQSPPSTGQMPCFIIYIPTNPIIDNSTYAIERRNNDYKIDLVICPTGQGTLAYNYNRALEYIEPTMDALWSHLRLYNTNTMGVMWTKPTYSRPKVLQYHWGGQAFFGIEFTVHVQSWRTITYGS